MDLQGLVDRTEIEEQLVRYARGVDTEDWELWKQVFTEDAQIDYSSVDFVVGTRDDVAEALAVAMPGLTWKQHYITNIDIRFDGDRAKVKAMFLNPMQVPDGDQISCCGGYYHHDFVRTADGWKSERLVEENLWFVNRPG
jgi:SnoaL-like domain